MTVASSLDRRRFVLGTALTALALSGVGSARAASDILSKEAVLYDPGLPVLGNPKGDVTIVEWFDYQCPYCKKSYPDVLDLVRADGKIRLVMKDWPIFGPESFYAARLTLAAGSGHAKAQHALMTTRGGLTQAAIDARLLQAGFDPKVLWASYQKDKARIDGILARNNAQADAIGLFATPAYMIGTTLFPGAISPADMRKAVAEARRTGAG